MRSFVLVRSSFDSAIQLYRQSRYRLAIDTLQSDLMQDPDNAPCHALWALCLAGEKHFDAAEDKAREALASDPLCEFSNYAHALVLVQSASRFGAIEHAQRMDRATDAIDEAIRIAPTQPDYYELKARLQLRSNNSAEAHETLATGLSFDPEHSGCLNLQADMSLTEGKIEEAVNLAQRALTAAPDESQSHATLGRALNANDDTESGIAHLSEALRIDPLNDAARASMVEALKRRSGMFRILNRPLEFWSQLTEARKRTINLVGLAVIGLLTIAGIILQNIWVVAGVLGFVALALSVWIGLRLLSDVFQFVALRRDEQSARFLSQDETSESNFLILSALWIGIAGVTIFAAKASLLLACCVNGLTAATPVLAHRMRPGQLFYDSRRVAVLAAVLIVLISLGAMACCLWSEQAAMAILVVASCASLGVAVLLFAD